MTFNGNTAEFSAPISRQIWEDKYRFVCPDKGTQDLYVEDTWLRIAKALSEAEDEENRAVYEAEFYEALRDWKFLPAGRITAGAGTGRDVTLFNCYVMGTIPDSMSGIFEMLREAALTMQQGGGIGYDFSTLRPQGAPVVGVGSDASGPLSFMDVWNSMCGTIMSAGARRGAMMGTMRCDHPDIEAFITAKSDPTRLRNFNMSVLVTDPFMEAVKNDWDWDLRFGDKLYRIVRARHLWDLIMQSTYDQAEPGVIFIDRINKTNNLQAVEAIAATNPCGEQPLPPYGACLLGSINLAKMVVNPFRQNAYVDWRVFKQTVSTAIRMMDNVVDVSKFPLPQQQKEAYNKRRLGLGITGLADMLCMLGVIYGSKKAVEWVDEVTRQLAISAYTASALLAKEKGPFPLWKESNMLENDTFLKGLAQSSPATEKLVREHGLRNSHLTSIAPTGTISLYAGNVSSGIEPIFAHSYTRKVLERDGSKREERVVDYAVSVYEKMFPGEDLPPYFVTAQNLSPDDHLKMQAAAQKWVDSSISKTINLPEDISFGRFKAVYWEAYETGCKGCTTYRPNPITGSVLSVDEAPVAEPEPVSVVETQTDAPTPRPDVLDGETYKLKWPGSQHALYITITDIVENGVKRPFEIFINSKNMDHFAWTVALTRMISAVFRRGGNVTFVAEELKAVFDPKGGAWVSGSYVPSILAAIGNIIETHLTAISGLDTEITQDDLASMAEWERTSGPLPPSCTSCGSFNLSKESGCSVCKDCGQSSCG